jgi:hypothetical protein
VCNRAGLLWQGEVFQWDWKLLQVIGVNVIGVNNEAGTNY